MPGRSLDETSLLHRYGHHTWTEQSEQLRTRKCQWAPQGREFYSLQGRGHPPSQGSNLTVNLHATLLFLFHSHLLWESKGKRDWHFLNPDFHLPGVHVSEKSRTHDPEALSPLTTSLSSRTALPVPSFTQTSKPRTLTDTSKSWPSPPHLEPSILQDRRSTWGMSKNTTESLKLEKRGRGGWHPKGFPLHSLWQPAERLMLLSTHHT